MVPLIKGDWGLRPAKEGGDGRLSGARLPVAYLMLSFSLDGIGPAKDHDALLRLGETVSTLAYCASTLGCRVLAISLL